MQLICKGTLKKKISGYIKAYKPNPAVIRLLDWLMNIIDGLPVFEYKQARWIGKQYCNMDGENTYCATCSGCNEEIVLWIYDSYCPNCGAEMRDSK